MRTSQWVWLVFAIAMFGAAPVGAQESNEAIAARQVMQENIRTLNARIEDLEVSNHSLRARVDDLRRELQQLREETRKLSDQSAIQDQVRRLGDAIKDVDSKRRADNEKVLGEFSKLARQIAETPVVVPPPSRPPPSSNHSIAPDSDSKPPRPAVPEKGIEYKVQSGDTLSGIVAACRAKELKVTQKMLKEANPDLNWDKLRVGQKVFIPLPNN